MTKTAKARHMATAADLASNGHHEVIRGEIMEKAAPSGERGAVQLGLGSLIQSEFGGRGGRARTGGWWLMTEVEIELAPHEVYRPDLVGWRIEHVAEMPMGCPVRVRPDWVCEILPSSAASTDLGHKRAVYHGAGVGHYWIVDTEHATLTVLRWQEIGYLVAQVANLAAQVRLEPFERIEVDLAEIFEFLDRAG